MMVGTLIKVKDISFVTSVESLTTISRISLCTRKNKRIMLGKLLIKRKGRVRFRKGSTER